MRAWRLTRGERGSVSVVTVAVLGVLLIVALGMGDVARTLSAAGRAQAAADAAALAAAQELALPEGRAPDDVAAEYATRNGAAIVTCDCAAGTFEATVTVRLEVGPLLLLGGDRSVQASARAVVDLP